MGHPLLQKIAKTHPSSFLQVGTLGSMTLVTEEKGAAYVRWREKQELG